MAFVKIEKLQPAPMRPTVKADARLWKTKDGKRLVPEGHRDAAILFCTPGRPVDREEYERLTAEFREAPEEVEAEEPPAPPDDPPPDKSEKPKKK